MATPMTENHHVGFSSTELAHPKPCEVNQERDHVDLESTADRQKDVQGTR